MREKVLEMEDLKKEMAFMHSAANKARKLDNASHEAEDRRGRSLDGSDSFATVSHLRAQVQVNLKIVCPGMSLKLLWKRTSGFRIS